MRKYVWAAVCSSLVAACGGGGSDAPAPVPASIAVTTTNQDQVARASVSAVASVATTAGGVTGSSGGAGVAGLPGVSRQIALALSGSRKTVLATGSSRPLASQSETVACPISGSITLTVNDANNNNQADAGDSISFTFTNCKTNADDNTNGSISVTLATFATTAVGANFSGTMSINLVASESATRSATVAGTVQASYTDLTTTQSRTDLTVGAAALTGTVTAGGVTETITYEAGFTISETDTTDVSGTTLSSSTQVSGTIASSVLSGRIVLQTVTPIVQLAADAYPSSGVLRVTGTSGSALRVTALNAVQVQIELDADGNGSYEASKTVNWTAVLPT